MCHDRQMPTPEPKRLLPWPVGCAALGHDLISAPDARVRRQRVTTWVALLTGVTFVVAGLVKFVFHHWELHAFRSFGLPWPSALEIFAGVLETAGGILLARRRAVVPAATLLGVTMVVAIISSGIGHGDVIPSLTLAPVLLLSTLFLLIRGLGLGGTGQV
jgi:putative oxidoreductase